MPAPQALHQLLERSAVTWPDRVALEETAGGAISYRELALLSDRVRNRLHRMGVRPGDRVGICLRKSIDAVAAIFGALKAGAAYVPVEPGAPAGRNAYILKDCSVRAVVAERQSYGALRAEIEQPEQMASFLVIDDVGRGASLREALARQEGGDPAPARPTTVPDPEALAYLLYTSGSTGRPKGVMLPQRSALSFIQWCSETFRPGHEDCFASHAPLHFDLSIFDIYVSIKHGARLVLIDDELGKDPVRLAATIASARISIWYSVPSILTLLAQYGKLERHSYPALRMVLFAGEVFPIKHLRRLKSLLPAPRYFNLYGPTETNVCTYHPLPAIIPEERAEPFPIGKTCSHLRAMVVDAQGSAVPAGTEGELCVSGPAVMQGYWNLPEENARAFLDATSRERWYRTGDVVVEDADGQYLFRGRRDRMVKRRGYRVELGEIEAGLYQHPAVKEAAVIGLTAEETGVQIKAFVSCDQGTRPSVIAFKRFCAEVLPAYMVPDLFAFPPVLPKTSTGKVDYPRLQSGA